MEVVIIVRDMDELGIPKEEQPAEFPYDIHSYVYDSKLAALDKYAETPCFWSELFSDIKTKEEIPALIEKVKQNVITGVINDFL